MFTISLPNKIDNLITISLGLYLFIPSHIFFLGVGYYTHTHIYIYRYKQIYWQPPTPQKKCNCLLQIFLWSPRLLVSGISRLCLCHARLRGLCRNRKFRGAWRCRGRPWENVGNTWKMLGKCVFKPMTVGNFPENSEMDMCVSWT